MKAGWQRKQLGEVCEILNGGTPKTGVPEYWGGNNFWITPAEMGKRVTPYVTDTKRTITDLGLRNSSAQMLPPNSVILSSRAPIGYLVINTSPMATNQGCKGLVPGNQLQHKFLYYYLSSILDLLNSLGTGATFKELSGGKLKEVPIPFPPLPEQQRIVRLLDEAFDRIATAKANAEKNLQNTRKLFENYLEAIFRQRGEGWVDAKLGDVCNKITDGTHITPTYTKEGVPFLSVKNLTKGFIDLSDTRFISPKEHTYLTRNNKPMRDDILYTKVGTTGIAKVIDVDDEFSIFVSVALLKPEHEIIFNFYLEHFLNAPFAREQAQKRTRGMANKNLVITDIKEIDIHFPIALNKQHAIVAKIDALHTETHRLESIYKRKLAALAELKKSLLHHAFNGEL
jgi:type I restriction enzyme S subunit